jgi:hypothetical protein
MLGAKLSSDLLGWPVERRPPIPEPIAPIRTWVFGAAGPALACSFHPAILTLTKGNPRVPTSRLRQPCTFSWSGFAVVVQPTAEARDPSEGRTLCAEASWASF